MTIKYTNDGCPTITFGKNVFVEFRNDWLQLSMFSKGVDWNWYDVSIALVEFHIEYDKVFTGWDIDIRLLGLGIRLRWNVLTEDDEKLLEEVEELIKDKQNGTQI